MKKNIFLYLFILATTGILRGQVQPTAAENYLYTKTCLNDDCTKKTETVTYYDGLARAKQNILLNATPQEKDIVNRIEYDSYGIQSKSYLPLPQQISQNGAIYTSPDASFYGGEKIYSENKIEEFPKARLTESYPQGTAWADKPNRYTYGTNAANEVKMYVAQTAYSNNSPSTSITQSVNYPIATLDKVTVTDADLNPSTEYKNGKGQTVMVSKNDGIHNTDTYYVYDNYGRLSYIIPPLASAVPLTTTNIDKLCYQYQYDTRGRQIAKKLPGKGWEYMVYDKADRLILTQDAMMNPKGQWLITKYDQFGRVAYTGILNTGGDRAARQNEINNLIITESRNTTGFTRNGITVYYTDNYYINEVPTILTVNYYDTYPEGSPTITTPVLGQNVLPQDLQNSTVSTRSLAVASYIKNIEDDNWTKMYNWYDNNGRNIATYSINHLGGYTKTETEIDFTGITKRAITKHKRSNTDIERTIIETFEYDSQNRLSVHTHQVDNNPVEILAQNSYNPISQLTNKKVGGTSASTPLQSIDYAYNIRGWLTKINDPKNLNGKLFGYEIKYNQVEGLQIPNSDYPDLQVKPKYNGNIAEVDWKTNTITGDYLRRYGYVYDGLNRLSAGFYQKDNNASAKEYFEKIEYDLNGNITNLKRSAETQQGASAFLIDNLTYVSDGNRLTSVTDSSTDYRGYPDVSGIAITYYEESGNMKSQKDKGILDIKYNYLNLPNSVTFDKTFVPRFPILGGDFNVNTQYLYRADGTKLRKTYTYGSGKTNAETSTRTEYLDGFQYEATSTTGKFTLGLKFIPTAEGYYNFENNKYIYSYTDHLGNVRLSYFKNGTSAEVLEENNYYPFGLKHEGYNPTAGNLSYQYKYNGKELQTESGMLDYGWRQYMPELGRWNGMDQLSEVYNSVSPYAYVGNNPINMFDPDGRKMSGTNGNGPEKEVQWDPNKPGGDNNPANIEEVVVGQKYSLTPPLASPGLLNFLLGSVTSSGDAFNNMLTSAFFGLSSNQAMQNYQQNLSNFQIAVNNSKAAKSTEEAEQFLFLELPASFMGGELLSAGWRAANVGKYLCRPIGRLSNGLLKLCFTEGTLVATDKGSKKIEDIKEGDLVWSYNEETGKKELKKVVELSRNTSSSLVKISVNGTEITCTPEHPFYVNGNWIEAQNLTKGTFLTTLDGTTSPVESINFLDEKVKVYNFEVEDNHNYYVSEKGILVHNNCETFLGLTDDLYAEGQYFVYSKNYISGNTYTKSISLLAKAQESTDLNLLLKTMFNEAKSHGATMLELRGTDIMNNKLFNEAVARRLGFTFEKLSESSIRLTSPIP
ncbi:RHS repeat-associated protein [Chryseobacterium ginsenosidimutans]|uniref:polymorphic toxin-type HINT domain-containing protein n=1 Tax=Chryseobacterium ginsenosidimutans TaxID=687846 RepID=UPI00216765B7|nr:polymorphic toxin-type HINT domain-containing protein [Chryseobacterium ginsenosidimutans]MCS3869423.1 RHS repeat-associated protein [Chryseobacterium ginsenosidimutans]